MSKDLSKQYAEKRAELQEEMRSLHERAQRENRELTDSENQRFFELDREAKLMDNAEIQRRASRLPEHTSIREERKRFVEDLIQVRDSGVPRDFVFNANGREPQFRASTPIPNLNNEAVVHDTSVPVLYQDLLLPLEQGFILNSLGAHFMYGVQGEPMWPSMTGSEATVLGENDEVSNTLLEFDSIKSTPKRISKSFAVSNLAINQSNLGLSSIVMRELALGVVRKLNHIAFDTVAHNDYEGPFVNLDSTQTLTSAGATFTIDDIVGLEHAVLNVLTDTLGGNSASYVMSYATAQKLRTTPIVKGQSEMILKMYFDGGEHYGVMNGRKVKFTNYAPNGTIYFGDYSFLAIPQYGDMRIIVNPYTLAKRNAMEFTLNTAMDMVKIRKEGFAKLTLQS